eukprot:SAG11_NODE_34285_length_272_cov_10.421965_1_plen_36_part_10
MPANNTCTVQVAETQNLMHEPAVRRDAAGVQHLKRG